MELALLKPGKGWDVDRVVAGSATVPDAAAVAAGK